ncbi:rhomboid family protein [Marinilabilia rubra]|uniref:Rhomboid family intramembrane serine protease n=1 Tax=Marinilabilia rubra TaxID=2162893 RepID=A0A2U2BDB2_9BACT|nr:rhomboid family intramembrane serine protease [Marinilabilia rubra]PWE01017.1 rhomboid family intramembrane serine protease [Marinilabilia rubra]
MSIWDEIKESFKEGTTLTKLIYVNIGVFVVIKLLQLILLLVGYAPSSIQLLVSWLSVPSDPMSLLFKPWTLFSYMFLHYDFFHVLFNVLYLYWFGRLFTQLIDDRKILTIYIWGGLGGAAIYILSFNLLPAFHSVGGEAILLGASASVMAILFAVARVRPNFTVYLFLVGPVKLKYLALIAFIIDLISIPGMNNAGGHLAHIGGALIGLYYGWKLSEGKITGGFFDKAASRTGDLFKKRSRMRVTHSRPMTDMEYNAHKVKRQKELDKILEKIKNSGYESLSKEEKKTLFNASKDEN